MTCNVVMGVESVVLEVTVLDSELEVIVSHALQSFATIW